MEHDQFAVQNRAPPNAAMHLMQFGIERRHVLVPLVLQDDFSVSQIGNTADAVQLEFVDIHYWNNERISLKLKGMSPVGYRTHSKTI